MNQPTASQPWRGEFDLGSTDEVPQVEDWVLDDAAVEIREVDVAPDTIPSPPPDEAIVGEAGPMTIPAPPPLGDLADGD